MADYTLVIANTSLSYDETPVTLINGHPLLIGSTTFNYNETDVSLNELATISLTGGTFNYNGADTPILNDSTIGIGSETFDYNETVSVPLIKHYFVRPVKDSFLQNPAVVGLTHTYPSKYFVNIPNGLIDLLDSKNQKYDNTISGLSSENSKDAIDELFEESLNTSTTEQTKVGNLRAESFQPTGGTGDQGKISWNADEETIDVIQNGATLQVGQEIYYHCRNNTGSTIANGTPVMSSGTIGASGRITITPMVGSVQANAKYLLGITTETIENDTDGKVTQFGKVRNIDTSSFSDGDVLWIDNTTTGDLTSTEPTSGIGMPIAFVITANANGTIMVRNNSLDEHLYLTKSDVDSYSNKTSAYTAGVNDFIFADTATTSAFTITLPATTTLGDKVTIHDNKGNFATNNLTVNGNSTNIMGSATLVLSVNDVTTKVIYDGTEWRVI